MKTFVVADNYKRAREVAHDKDVQNWTYLWTRGAGLQLDGHSEARLIFANEQNCSENLSRAIEDFMVRSGVRNRD